MSKVSRRGNQFGESEGNLHHSVFWFWNNNSVDELAVEMSVASLQIIFLNSRPNNRGGNCN